MGSLELGSTLCILSLTMLKSLASIMMINSESFRLDVAFLIGNALDVFCLFYRPCWFWFFFAFRYVWESKADGAFAISEDTWNEPLGRGTEIRLHLKEEAGEYVEEYKLKVCPNYYFNNHKLLEFKITSVLFLLHIDFTPCGLILLSRW